MEADQRSSLFVLPGFAQFGFPVVGATRVALSLEVEDGFDPLGCSVCIAFDPGGTTGWALFGFLPSVWDADGGRLLDGLAFWSAGEFFGPENKQAKEMLELCRAWPGAAIVIEDFVLRQANMDRALLSPVRITAAVSYGLSLAGRVWHSQQPALAMGAATDERLKLWGLHGAVRGKEHARDAVRHAITWCRREQTLRRKGLS